MNEQENRRVNAAEIHLQSVKVINGSISANPDLDPTTISEFKMDFLTKTGTNVSANLVRIVFTIALTGLNIEKKNLDVSASYTIDFGFTIDSLERFVVNSDTSNELFIDSNLGATLMSIVYSTTRGIILTRTQGTIIDGVILPVIDPKTLLNITSQLKQSENEIE